MLCCDGRFCPNTKSALVPRGSSNAPAYPYGGLVGNVLDMSLTCPLDLSISYILAGLAICPDMRSIKLLSHMSILLSQDWVMSDSIWVPWHIPEYQFFWLIDNHMHSKWCIFTLISILLFISCSNASCLSLCLLVWLMSTMWPDRPVLFLSESAKITYLSRTCLLILVVLTCLS